MWDEIKMLLWAVIVTCLPGILLYGYAVVWFMKYGH